MSCASTLKKLKLRNHYLKCDEEFVVNVLKELNNVEDLDLSFSKLTDEGIQAVKNGLPKLKKVDMCGMKDITEEGIVSFLGKKFKISNNDLTFFRKSSKP